VVKMASCLMCGVFCTSTGTLKSFPINIRNDPIILRYITEAVEKASLYNRRFNLRINISSSVGAAHGLSSVVEILFSVTNFSYLYLTKFFSLYYMYKTFLTVSLLITFPWKR
jgi:hypothetical protein